MKRHQVLVSGIAVCAAAILTSCSSSPAATSNPGGRPSVLRYCFSTNSEEPDAAIRRLELVRAYLSRTLHMQVDATQTTGYGAVIEALRADKVDVASISPFSYIIASEKVPIEAIVMRGTKDGAPGEYGGVLAVPGDSPIHSVDDLVKHSRELTISFVDPASASGFLVQNAYLQSRGLDPQRDFKKVLFSMNHPASLMTLKAHKVDVAASMERMVKRYLDTRKLAPGDIRVIWVSPQIPNQPIAVRKSLPAAFREEIRRAFLEMPQKDPVAWANMSPKTLPMPAGQVYVPANDAMFDGLRKMAKGVPNLSLLEQ